VVVVVPPRIAGLIVLVRVEPLGPVAREVVPVTTTTLVEVVVMVVPGCTVLVLGIQVMAKPQMVWLLQIELRLT
jgi:hypothetical protein